MSSMTDLRRTRGLRARRSRQRGWCAAHPRQRGFSLVELMIASTIGLLILTAMVSVFVSSSQSRDEVDKSSRQIENGRFAIEMLKEDIQLAAFYGDYFPAAVTWTTPDPCATILNDMGFTTGNVPVGIHGYPDSVAAPSCVANRKSGTDILVIHRVSTTQLKIDANEDGTADANVTKEDGSTGVSVASLGAGHYLQASNCADTPSEATNVMTKNTAGFILHGVKPAGTPPSCMNGGLAPVRQYFVRIYYIATCNDCSGAGDGIPTLKMVELTPGSGICDTDPALSCGAMTTRPIAEGIENMQLEWGVDNKNCDGTTTTATPGTPKCYFTAPGASDWQNVTAVKLFLLARNTDITVGYKDAKTYSLASDGSALAGTPYGDRYKRHVYVAMARAINIANRR
jgi:type IV pilus assembly protein PilW